MGERTLSYEEGDLSDIELAYAISIQFKQGSEFAIVIMPVFHTQRNMLTELYHGLDKGERNVD